MQLTEVKPANNSFTWLDITAPSMEDLIEISKRYNLSNHHIDDCLEPDHLPKFEEGDDFNFIILRRVVSKDAEGNTVQDLTTKIAIFYNEKTIVTIHRLPHADIQEVCEQLMKTGKITSVNQLLLKVIAKVQQRYTEFSAHLNGQIEAFETGLFIRKTALASIESLYMLKRRTGLCRKLLLLTGEVVSAVRHRQKKSNEMQDIGDNQVKLQLFYDQLSEDSQNLVSAYFLPLTFIVGIYGMNFDIMPELRYQYGYPIIMGLMLLIFLLIFFWFKRRKWL